MDSWYGWFRQLWIERWKKTWQERNFRYRFIATLLFLFLTVCSVTRFLNWAEKRPGTKIRDPILSLFTAQDVHWIIFTIIYLAVFVGLIHLSQNPKKFLLALQAYILLLFARMTSIYLLPLEAPVNLIPLQDPFLESLSSRVLTKDLFFSGHTSTLFLIYLSSSGRIIRIFFLSCTILVTFFILMQHVHYSIDVMAAPFFSYSCYHFSIFIARKFNQ